MTLHHPGGHAGCSGDTLSSTFFVTGVRHSFVAVHILLEWEISRKSSGKAYLPLFSELGYNLEHSGGYPYYSGHPGPGSHIPSRELEVCISPEDVRQCSCRARPSTPPHLSPHIIILSTERQLGQSSPMNTKSCYSVKKKYCKPIHLYFSSSLLN